MLQPDGTLYFYSRALPEFCQFHTFLYVIHHRQFRTCGLCFLKQGFETELPQGVIHEKRVLAENGNPQMHGQFLAWLEGQLGLRSPSPDESLTDFRLARKQYREPNRRRSPVTYAMWDMFGKQPKMARPLWMMLTGATEAEVSESLNLSIYRVQTTVAKALRMAAGYIR